MKEKIHVIESMTTVDYRLRLISAHVPGGRSVKVVTRSDYIDYRDVPITRKRFGFCGKVVMNFPILHLPKSSLWSSYLLSVDVSRLTYISDVRDFVMEVYDYILSEQSWDGTVTLRDSNGIGKDYPIDAARLETSASELYGFCLNSAQKIILVW